MGIIENMRKAFVALALLSAVAACSTKDMDNSDDEIRYLSENHTYNGLSIEYRKAEIAAGTESRSALVIYLHGGTSKGSDNESQLNEPGVDRIADYLLRHRINSIVVVPQCPKDKSWGEEMGQVLKSLLDECVTSCDVDRNRLYILGGSMGGTGTWTMLSTYPGLFAAAMPVAGNPSKCKVENVAQTPVLTVMGTADRIMNLQTVEDFIGRLTISGNENRLDVEEGWTHETTCKESYTDERLDWVFSKKRQGKHLSGR